MLHLSSSNDLILSTSFFKWMFSCIRLTSSSSFRTRILFSIINEAWRLSFRSFFAVFLDDSVLRGGKGTMTCSRVGLCDLEHVLGGLNVKGWDLMLRDLKMLAVVMLRCCQGWQIMFNCWGILVRVANWRIIIVNCTLMVFYPYCLFIKLRYF